MALPTPGERLAALEARVLALEQGRQMFGSLNIREAIAVIRDCGVGDIVMLSPSLKALKEKHPDRPLVLITKPENFDILQGAPYLDAILPLAEWRGGAFHQVYDLCHAVESNNRGGKLPIQEYLSTPRPEVFAKLLGVADSPRQFLLPLHPGAFSAIRGILHGCKRPFIGLAPTCRSPLRTMPPDYVEPLLDLLLKSYDGTVVLLGKTESWSKHLASLKKLGMVNLLDRLTLKDMVASCYLMDAMIAPDTGSMHLAGALGVKCLAVMANNNPKNFAGFYPSVEVLQPTRAELPCFPCHDQRESCGLKPRQYGAKCMQLLTPERIHAAFRKFYNGRNVALVRDISLDRVGGAEITDKATVKQGRERGYNVRVFDEDTTVDHFYDLLDYDLIIVSNIWLLSKEKVDILMKALLKVPYIKWEHDHRSLDRVVNRVFPKAVYAAPLFKNSLFNVFVSPAHRENYRQGLGDGICIMPALDLDLYQPAEQVDRQPNSILIGTPRKWGQERIDDFIAQHPQARVDLWGDNLVPPEKMPEIYSRYEYFAHLPRSRWSCERVIFEAALCGCKVLTNANAQGTSWEAPLDDPKALHEWLRERQDSFWNVVGARVYEEEHEIPGYRRHGLRRLSSGPTALEPRA